MARKDDFNRHVLLLPGLTTTAIQKAIDHIEKDKAIYQSKDVKLIGGKAVPGNGD